MQIQARITQIIESKHLRYCEIAKDAGLTKQALCDMLKGRKLIRCDHILPLCNALQITPNDLFADDNPPSSHRSGATPLEILTGKSLLDYKK